MALTFAKITSATAVLARQARLSTSARITSLLESAACRDPERKPPPTPPFQRGDHCEIRAILPIVILNSFQDPCAVGGRGIVAPGSSDRDAETSSA
jgi:hypothetical protein